MEENVSGCFFSEHRVGTRHVGQVAAETCGPHE